MSYLQEWGESCVDDQLTRLNVTALEGDRTYNYLLYAEGLPRRNDGRLRDAWLKRYQHIEQGGWWCSGIDLLTGEEDLWGCFKPNLPRLTKDCRKTIKYEHPPKTATGLFALRVPLPLWEKISQRYDQPIQPQDITPDQPDNGFWQWLMDHPNIPLCITEGAKKAGALLTAGYVAIALPGVNGGYRVPKDAAGQRIGKSKLIPQLAKLAQQNRQFYITFDQDQKPNTIKAVNTAIRQTGYLLTQQGCDVKVITWKPQWGKGVDDLIANQGQKIFDHAYHTALSLESWKAQSLNQLTYPPSLWLNHRYLSPVEVPENARLIGIKSPKGTGKTQFLEKIVKEAQNQGKWVLVIGHRVKLVEALCQRFGLSYITQVKDHPHLAIQGYGLCIDSLHPNSLANFNAANWEDGIVIIDEVEQVLWHGLNSSTCRGNRVAILKSLKTLMENVLGGDGQVYVADADLSDISIDYLLSLAGVPQPPYIICNEWKPDPKEAWQVYHYADNTPDGLLQDLEKHITEGGKPFVCLSAQKLRSQWGTCNLEAYLTQKFPHKSILRIDSESVADPTHPAYGCTVNLNGILGDYEIILASPCVETGVSIDLEGHFTSVWAIAQGIQGENAVRQAIGRIRENIPRYLWVASYGFNQVGNGSTSIPQLLGSGQRLTQLNIKLLQQSDFAALDDLETGFQAESLLCWGKFAVRFNQSMLNYREAVLTALVREGHQLQEVVEKGTREETTEEKEEKNPDLTQLIIEVRDRNYQEECCAIADSPDISEREYNTLKKQLVKTLSERRKLRKYDLKRRYGLTLTPELVQQDDQGWYSQLRLHYFLTVGRSYLAERDAAIAKKLIDQGEGDIFLPDFNNSQLGAKIGIMERLGIPVLMQHPERELRNTDIDLKNLQKIAIENRSFLKTATGIKLAKNSSPVLIVRRFLEQMGYGVECIKCEGKRMGGKISRKKRVRVYKVSRPDDRRNEVFSYWLGQSGNCDYNLDKTVTVSEHPLIYPVESQYQQLTLFS